MRVRKLRKTSYQSRVRAWKYNRRDAFGWKSGRFRMTAPWGVFFIKSKSWLNGGVCWSYNGLYRF